jgi:cytochrome c
MLNESAFLEASQREVAPACAILAGSQDEVMTELHIPKASLMPNEYLTGCQLSCSSCSGCSHYARRQVPKPHGPIV